MPPGPSLLQEHRVVSKHPGYFQTSGLGTSTKTIQMHLLLHRKSGNNLSYTQGLRFCTKTVRLAVVGQRSPTNPVAKTQEGHNQQSSSWLRRKHLSLLSPLLRSSNDITPPNFCFAALSPSQGSCSPWLSQDPASSSAPLSFLSACSKTRGNSSRPGPAVEKQASALRGKHHRKGQLTLQVYRLTCLQTRDFSSRYCSIFAPSMAPLLLKWMSMYFPNRLELSLRMVFAFPKAAGKNCSGLGRIMDLVSWAK